MVISLFVIFSTIIFVVVGNPVKLLVLAGAVNGLMGQVLEGHIREHMQPLAVDGEPEATEGLIKVLRSYLK